MSPLLQESGFAPLLDNSDAKLVISTMAFADTLDAIRGKLPAVGTDRWVLTNGVRPGFRVALALKTVTLHARHYGWADKTFGRKWAVPDKDPAKSWDNKFAIEDTLDKVALARAKASDANSFLYLAKANQLFVTGHKGTLGDGLRNVRAKVLLVPAQSDVLLFPAYSVRAMAILKSQGREVGYLEIDGDGGHLDGVLAVTRRGRSSENS